MLPCPTAKTFRRTLLVALLAVAAAPAFATGPSERVEMRSGSLLGLALVADIDRTSEAAGVGQFIEDRAMVGVGWRHDGWKISATAGSFGYAYTGASEGIARAVSFAAGYEAAMSLGGKLSFELRQTVLFEGENRLDVTEARLGWSLKF